MSKFLEEQFPVDSVIQLEMLQLLSEVANFLGRLPANPVSYRMKRKIEEHLAHPGAHAQKVRLEQAAMDQQWANRLQSGECFTGVSRFTDEGAPVVDCLVLGGQVHLRSPALIPELGKDSISCPQQIVESIARDLVEGIDIKLMQVNMATSKYVAKNWPHHRHQIK